MLWLFSIVECGIARFLCATRVFEVRASSSSLCQISFLLHLHCAASPYRKIAYSITQSLDHSPSLFDAPATEGEPKANRRRSALALRNINKLSSFTYLDTGSPVFQSPCKTNNKDKEMWLLSKCGQTTELYKQNALCAVMHLSSLCVIF